jgi:hypothetical protein
MSDTNWTGLHVPDHVDGYVTFALHSLAWASGSTHEAVAEAVRLVADAYTYDEPWTFMDADTVTFDHQGREWHR